LNMIAERNPQVAKAVVKLRELSADERAHDTYERREKARRDQAAQIRWEIRKIAKNALQMKLPLDDIIKLTGLTREEIENLNGAD